MVDLRKPLFSLEDSRPLIELIRECKEIFYLPPGEISIYTTIKLLYSNIL